MKVAIIGAGPQGLEITNALIRLGAHVVWFSRNSRPGQTLSLLKNEKSIYPNTWKEITSQSGRERLNWSKDLNHKPSSKEYYEEYFKPLSESSDVLGSLKVAEVLRVQKCHLMKSEMIDEKSRLGDLFRVVYRVDIEDGFQKQLEENPEVFKNLDEGIIKSLSEKMELYEDFDLVVETSGKSNYPRFMGPSNAPAINEEFASSHGNIFYGNKAFESKINENESIAVVGTGLTSAVFVDRVLKQNRCKLKELIIITSESAPFHDLKRSSLWNSIGEDIQEKLMSEYDIWKSKCFEIENSIKEWRQRPDYEKAKVPCPQIPEPWLKILPSYDITNVDKLLDQDGIFLTCEKPSFREGKEAHLHTLRVDKVFVLSGFKKTFIGSEYLNLNENQIIHNEPGYYTLSAHDDNIRFGLNEIEEKINLIIDDILGYFSKSE